MKSFDDAHGRTWDAAVGKESYGTFVVLFARRGDHEVRKAPLGGDIRHQAEECLSAMTTEDLRRVLDASVGWSDPLRTGTL